MKGVERRDLNHAMRDPTQICDLPALGKLELTSRSWFVFE